MICFDVDMTLLDHKDYTIPESAMRAMELLKKSGRKVVIATGRDMDNYYSRKYRDIIQPDAIIHQNGTRITVGGKQIFEHHFDRKLLRDILSWCDREGFAIGMTAGDSDYYVHPEIVREMDLRLWGESGRRFHDPGELLHMPVRTLAALGTPEDIAKIAAHYPQLNFPIFSTRTGADVMEKEFSKANGLVRLARYYGEPEDLSGTVAFVDSMNDIEVIRAAGTGVAMGNAIPELKAVADLVTDNVGDNGIWNACVRLGLIPGKPLPGTPGIS